MKIIRITVNLFLILFCSICFSPSSSCKKAKTGVELLPPITSSGQNTFGCLINGQPWVPYVPCWKEGGGVIEFWTDIEPMTQGRDLPMLMRLHFGSIAAGTNSYFEIDAPNPSFYPGISGCYNYFDSLSIDYEDEFGGLDNLQGISNSMSNYFNITTLDTINGIIAGTFQFTLYHGPRGSPFYDSVLVTDGRFDLKFGQNSHCSN